jgi:hypothetical protein
MLTATLAMAPIYSLRLTSRDETDRAAQAATLEFVSRAGHERYPPNYVAAKLRRSPTNLHLVGTNCARRRPLATYAVSAKFSAFADAAAISTLTRARAGEIAAAPTGSASTC